MEKKRKAYLRDSSKSIPKSTAWRLKKHQNGQEVPAITTKRRKLYLRSGLFPIPESTIQSWEDTQVNFVRFAEGDGSGGFDSFAGDVNGGGPGNVLDNEGERSSSGVSISGGDRDGRMADSGEGDDSAACVDGEMGDSGAGDGDDYNILSDHSFDNEKGAIIGGDSNKDDNSDSEISDDENFSDGVSDDFGDSSSNNLADVGNENSAAEIISSGGGTQFTGSTTSPLLYDSAPLSISESMYATYLYSVKNKLSYHATNELLELIRLHLPSPNLYPQSLHSLKRQLGLLDTVDNFQQFCSSCMEEISQQGKYCVTCGCQTLSHFISLPFDKHLQEMFSGNIIANIV